MQKSFFLSVIIIATVVFYFDTIDAQVTPSLPTIGNGISFRTVKSEQFSGRIAGLKAREISLKEDAGYKCEVPGTSIEVQSLREGGVGYVIPSGLRPITKHELRTNQKIIGKRRGTSNITCEKCDEKGENCVKANFSLSNIRLYATSQK